MFVSYTGDFDNDSVAVGFALVVSSSVVISIDDSGITGVVTDNDEAPVEVAFSKFGISDDDFVDESIESSVESSNDHVVDASASILGVEVEDISDIVVKSLGDVSIIESDSVVDSAG